MCNLRGVPPQMPFKIIKATAPFPFQVCDSLGMPHVELTLFACNAGKYLSEATAKSYTREIVHFASWIEADILCKRQGWTLLSSPEQVRVLIIHFLNSKVKCVVAIGRDRAGFDTRRIEPTWETSRPVAKLFAALRIFFEFLIERKLYAQQNPMEGDNAKELIAEQIKNAKAAFVSIHGRNPMPQESGVDDIRNIRSVASYFRNTSKGWLPEILDSPALFNDVIACGERWGWSLREVAIARILFDTGCRIHEVCSLSLFGWSSSHFQKEILCVNKGSHGRLSKRLYISDKTQKILIKYVEQERSLFSQEPKSITEIAVLPPKQLANMPIFLGKAGRALTPDHFRRNYWTPALRSSGMKLRPHQVRHWFVTMALNDIKARAKNPEELQNFRSSLLSLMAWRTDMIPTYDQAMQHHNLPTIASELHHALETRQEAENIRILENQANDPTPLSRSLILLKEMLGS